MRPYTPVGEFVHHHGGSKRYGLLVLRAYFDDSGTHGGSEVVVWAGFMATCEEWGAIEEEWDALLRRYEITSFHATDVGHAERECEGWGINKREAAFLEFSRLLTSRNVAGISSVVRRSDWNAVPDPGIRSLFPQPSHLTFEHCMQQALNLAQGASLVTGKIEKVSLYFDCGAASNREGAVGYDLARQYKSSWVVSPWFDQLGFRSVTDTIPLQAADLLAYETFRLEAARVNRSGASDEPLRRPLEILLESPAVRGQRYDVATLKVLADEIAWGFPPDLLAPFELGREPSS